MLHSLEKPFSAASGGFILQHLMFDQTRTNFTEVYNYEMTNYRVFIQDCKTLLQVLDHNVLMWALSKRAQKIRINW
jgi:midasin (ATPase involved in ribosome maturation)